MSVVKPAHVPLQWTNVPGSMAEELLVSAFSYRYYRSFQCSHRVIKVAACTGMVQYFQAAYARLHGMQLHVSHDAFLYYRSRS